MTERNWRTRMCVQGMLNPNCFQMIFDLKKGTAGLIVKKGNFYVHFECENWCACVQNDMLTKTIVGSPTPFLPRWGNWTFVLFWIFWYERFGCIAYLYCIVTESRSVLYDILITVSWLSIISCYHTMCSNAIQTPWRIYSDVYDGFVKRVIVEEFWILFYF